MSTEGPASNELDDADGRSVERVRISMDKRIDFVISLVVAAVGAYICYLASGFRIGSFPDPVTARGLPYFTGGFMVFVGIVGAVRRLVTWSYIPGPHTVSEGSNDEIGHPASALRSFTIAAVAFVWVALLRWAGFVLITPPVLLTMLLLMGVRSPGKLVAFPIAFTFLIWFCFSQLLGIILPLGPLSNIARSWGLMP